jgi:CheY-like chemotaxis protein
MDGRTILVVENDDVTRKFFATVLGTVGYAVRLAANGKEALEYLQTHYPPDLITLAMLMPIMDGWHFLKERDARWHSIPVLIVTVLEIGNQEWAASLGARGFLQKPVKEEALLAQVEKCLASR